MNKIKLVVSDFHIGKGLILEDGSINTLEDFVFDEKFIDFLEYYSQQEYREAEVELILNGDFMNTLQVDYRREFPTEITEQIDVEKVNEIFEGHPKLFDALAEFAAKPHHSITYVTGNHDPALHWPAVRALLDERLSTHVTYPDFRYAFDGVLVEHGHQHTAANRYSLRRLFVQKGNNEPVLNLPWGAYFIINYLNQIKRQRPYIDRVRPFGYYLMQALVYDTGFAVTALARLIWFFLRQRFRPGSWRKEDLWATFQIIKETTIIPRLESHAADILRRSGYHTVIFGHAHQAMLSRPFHFKVYINTGTWNEIINLDIPNLGRQHRMTYAMITYDDQGNAKAGLKLWKGRYSVEEDIIFYT